MDHWVTAVTEAAVERLLEHASRVGLQNTEEFTFRSFFMACAASHLDMPVFQTEWHRFDLLVREPDNVTLIEFKYYILRRTIDLDGQPLRYKGGAGPKNESEFWDCVRKLRDTAPAAVADRFLVLIYERETKRASKYSFHASYGRLSSEPPVADVWAHRDGPLEARVLRIGSR